MKINLDGWKPFKTLQYGQWYHRDDRPAVMNKLATFILKTSGTNVVMSSLRDRYFSHPCETNKWFDLDGELARVVSEVLNET